MTQASSPDYEVIRELGKGSFGCATLVKNAATGQRAVIKVQGLRADGNAEREARVMERFHHQHIVKYVDSWVEDNPKWVPDGDQKVNPPQLLFIVMDFCDGGDLRQAIRQRRAQQGGGFEEPLIRAWIAQIASALHYCHTEHVLHRDLKAENVLVHEGRLKLADFGLSRETTSSTMFCHTRVGTPHYLPPEITEHATYNTRADMWCLGIILYELMSLKRPFQAESVPVLLRKILSCEPDDIAQVTKNAYSPDLYDLCRALLSKTPISRPSARELLELPRFRHAVNEIFQPLSESHKLREQRAWKKIIFNAAHESTFVLELWKPETKVNIRREAHFDATIVRKIASGEMIEATGRFTDEVSGCLWFQCVDGFCIGNLPDKPKEGIFREVPAWRIRRPSQQLQLQQPASPHTPRQQQSLANQSTPATQPHAASSASSFVASPMCRPTNFPESSSPTINSKEEEAAAAAMVRACQLPTREEAAAALTQFAVGQGLPIEALTEVVGKYGELATELDDVPWSLFASDILRLHGCAYLMQTVRQLVFLLPPPAQAA